MKTAIIKTSFWKEDKIFELLPDARFFYLCLLTNPERNGTSAFKCSDRLMVAYTGYDIKTIEICQKQLIEHGLIEMLDGFYIINEQDNVIPKKGRLSSTLYEKDFNSLPLNIQELLMNRSSTAHECIGNSIGISKSVSNKKEKTVHENATNYAEYLHSSLLKNYPMLNIKPNSVARWSIDIEKINRIDNYEWATIKNVLLWSQTDEFWKKQIQSGSNFRKNFNRMLTQMQNKKNNTRIHNI